MDREQIEKPHILKFLLLIFLSSFLIILSWQGKREFIADFSQPESSAFISSVPDRIKYGETAINLPWVGNLGRNRFDVEFMIRGAVFDRGGLQPLVSVAINGIHQEKSRLGIEKLIKKYRYDGKDSTLLLSLNVHREEGVKLRYVKVYYVKITPLAAANLCLPPIKRWLMLTAFFIILFSIPLILRFREAVSWFVFLIFLTAFSLLMAFNRMQAAIVIERFFIASIFLLLLSFILRPILMRLLSVKENEREECFYVNLLCLILVLFIGIKFVFVTHPSLISLDIGYHIRNLVKVLAGDFHLTTVFPGDIYKIPYPPLFYLIIAPFTIITDNYPLLFKVLFVSIELLAPIVLAVIAKNLLGNTRYAFWAFLTYNLIPFSYRVISAGIVAEMFSQLLFLLLILVLIKHQKINLKNGFLLFCIIFGILMSHFGAVIKFYMSIAALAILPFFFKKTGIQFWRILAVVFLATLSAYIIFYVHYNDVIVEGIEKVVTIKSPIPEARDKPLLSDLFSQSEYFGRFFFLLGLTGILGMIVYFTSISKKAGSHNKNKALSSNQGFSENRSVQEKTWLSWLLISYLMIFLFGWLTPLKTRHFTFLLIIISLFGGYVLGNLKLRLGRCKAYLIIGLLISILYLTVILNRLVFYFYRVNIR